MRKTRIVSGILRKWREGPGRLRRPEEGSALVIAILIMVIMSLMGLAFALVAETENKISVNERHQAQALYVAEGTVRLVKGWFDDPASGYLVPTSSQADRSLRYVDHDGDGTYQLYSSAPSPWNVTYRSGTNDLFEKPYRGSPSVSLEGTQANPDVRISASGASAEQAFLNTINNTVFPNYPAPGLRAKVRQIDVYSPPILAIGAQRVRYGVATILVTVGIYDKANTASETQIAERVVKAVINEAPYPGPVGPLQSCVDISVNGDWSVGWGKVTAVGNINLHANATKTPSGLPWYDINRYIARDMDLNGTVQLGPPLTPDDSNANGTADFDEFTGGIEDPWLRFWAQGVATGGTWGTACGSVDCQPNPFTPPSTGSTDHSNIFDHVGYETCPVFDYDLWKQVALSGGQNVHYYAYDSASGDFKENGVGTAVSFETATSGVNGLFFFDTTDSIRPHDDNGDSIFDNLTPAIALTSQYATAGFIYLNAQQFSATGAGFVPSAEIIAPAEPYVDTNGNSVCDAGEYVYDLTYPGSLGSNYTLNALRQQGVGYTRYDPSLTGNTEGRYTTGVNVYGVLYTNGQYNADGNWTYFGSVITKEGFSGTAAGTPNIYFDERLIKGAWPPPNLNLPRTVITAWETDM